MQVETAWHVPVLTQKEFHTTSHYFIRHHVDPANDHSNISLNRVATVRSCRYNFQPICIAMTMRDNSYAPRLGVKELNTVNPIVRTPNSLMSFKVTNTQDWPSRQWCQVFLANVNCPWWFHMICQDIENRLCMEPLIYYVIKQNISRQWHYWLVYVQCIRLDLIQRT